MRGYQGSGRPLAKDKVFSTMKHFAVHGPHEGGINAAPSNFGERAVRDEYSLPVRGGRRRGEARCCVMPSYIELDGIPSHMNKLAAADMLRGEWGFDGLVVSDYFAIGS